MIYLNTLENKIDLKNLGVNIKDKYGNIKIGEPYKKNVSNKEIFVQSLIGKKLYYLDYFKIFDYLYKIDGQNKEKILKTISQIETHFIVPIYEKYMVDLFIKFNSVNEIIEYIDNLDINEKIYFITGKHLKIYSPELLEKIIKANKITYDQIGGTQINFYKKYLKYKKKYLHISHY